MKKLLKIFGILVGVVIIIVIAGLIYLNTAYPKVDPPSAAKVQATPERIARGKYLANHVTNCFDCHSERDWSKYSGPLVPGTLGKGGEEFNKEMMGIPGDLYAANITPYSIGNWTDGELMRTITNGVKKDNEAIFPLMPYMSYNHLSKEDLYSIVAYLRTLKPIKNDVKKSSLDFPMNMIVKLIPPKSYKGSPAPNKSDTLNYGKYLVTIAGCADCHTPMEKGKAIENFKFAGGMEFNLPAGTVRSANITPDLETGIGKWTKEQFINTV